MAGANTDRAIDRLLNDPMTRAIMRADGVDRDALRETLREVAAERRPPDRVSRWIPVRAACCRGVEACAW